MSLERGSTAVLQGERKGNHEEHIRIPKQIAILSPEKKKKESWGYSQIQRFIHISSHLETPIQDTYTYIPLYITLFNFGL